MRIKQLYIAILFCSVCLTISCKSLEYEYYWGGIIYPMDTFKANRNRGHEDRYLQYIQYYSKSEIEEYIKVNTRRALIANLLINYYENPFCDKLEYSESIFDTSKKKNQKKDELYAISHLMNISELLFASSFPCDPWANVSKIDELQDVGLSYLNKDSSLINYNFYQISYEIDYDNHYQSYHLLFDCDSGKYHHTSGGVTTSAASYAYNSRDDFKCDNYDRKIFYNLLVAIADKEKYVKLSFDKMMRPDAEMLYLSNMFIDHNHTLYILKKNELMGRTFNSEKPETYINYLRLTLYSDYLAQNFELTNTSTSLKYKQTKKFKFRFTSKKKEGDYEVTVLVNKKTNTPFIKKVKRLD